MEKIFKSIGGLLYTEYNHSCYCISWKNISPFVKKWSKNRKPDDTRIQEMMAYHKSGGYIPRIIHLAELKNEGLICYDGNHRRVVFDLLEDEEVTCIVDIIFNAQDSDVLSAFENINKSVQVPVLYTQEMDPLVKSEILKLVKKYERKYPDFLSASANCHRPNFNRDTFVENITTIYNHFEGKKSVDDIQNTLENLNVNYEKKHAGKVSLGVKTKCNKFNFWLFSCEKQIAISSFVD